MSRIRGKDTKPELMVRRYLFSKGFRYRIHAPLPGRPDIVLPRYKAVVFVHGCFWHGHEGCAYFVVPKTNPEKWMTKINTNRSNDVKNISQLTFMGWRVFVVWECQLKKGRAEGTLAALAAAIRDRAEVEEPG